jgi:hypothetical protein
MSEFENLEICKLESFAQDLPHILEVAKPLLK